jgi:hypothetical protein
MRMGCIHDVRSTKAAAHTSNDFGDEIYDIITKPRERENSVSIFMGACAGALCFGIALTRRQTQQLAATYVCINKMQQEHCSPYIYTYM